MFKNKLMIGLALAGLAFFTVPSEQAEAAGFGRRVARAAVRSYVRPSYTSGYRGNSSYRGYNGYRNYNNYNSYRPSYGSSYSGYRGGYGGYGGYGYPRSGISIGIGSGGYGGYGGGLGGFGYRGY